MKIAVPSRHGRLLVLCGLSSAVHLLVLNLVARHGAGARPTDADAGAPLVVRLAPPPLPSASPPAQAAAPMSGPTPRRAQGSVAPAAIPAFATTPAAPAPPAHSTVPAGTPASPSGPGAQPAPVDMLSLRPHYQIALPASVRLVYQVSAGAAAAPSAQEAFLDWRSDGSAYALEMDGVLGHRSSSGIVGDDGIEPQHAREQQAERTLDTSFDVAARRITLADGVEAPWSPGTLDAAMMWIWLASVANASAGQLRDSIDVNVADADGVHPLRLAVVGQEDVDTGLGRIKAWHLAQVAHPGETRVDAWLAPAQDWLPVQLRVTREDGSVATQVLQRRGNPGAR